MGCWSCRYAINKQIKKETSLIIVLLISVVAILELFLYEVKKLLQLFMHFKNFRMSLVVNQKKYGWTHVVSFTIDQWNQGGKIVILKFIQHTMN